MTRNEQRGKEEQIEEKEKKKSLHFRTSSSLIGSFFKGHFWEGRDEEERKNFIRSHIFSTSCVAVARIAAEE